jgi:hypothetical protein
MPYIKRDDNGNIISLFGLPQLKENLEYLPEEHPEVIAFRNRTLAPESDPIEEKIQAELRAMAIESLKSKGELAADYTDQKIQAEVVK